MTDISATDFFRRVTAAAEPTFEHEEIDTGGSKRPTKINLHAVDPDSGDRMGTLTYHVPRRKADKILIEHLGTEDAHRRKGVGSALMDEMQRRHPGTPIDHGDRTDAGKKWWAGYSDGKKVTRGRTMASADTPVPDNTQPYQREHPWLPRDHFFEPTKPGLDPRLFDGERMRPEVRQHLLSLLNGFWAPKYGDSWQTWARVYVAGSEASHFYGNNDLDVLIGIDHEAARHHVAALADMSDSEIDAFLTDELRKGLTSRTDQMWMLVNSESWQKDRSTTPPSLKSSASTPRSDGQPARSAGISASSSMPSATTWTEQAYLEIMREGRLGPGRTSGAAPSADRQRASSAASARPVSVTTDATTTDETSTASRPSSTRRCLPNSTAAAASAVGTTSPSPSTMTTIVAQERRRAGSASEASSAFAATTPSDTSESVILAPQSATWSDEKPPPSPPGYTWTGPWEATWYCNPDSYDIRDIKPYAAYDITRDEWAVRPVETPADFGPEKLPESTWDVFDALQTLIKAIAELPAGVREREGAALYDYLHTDRHSAFGPEGTGLYDPANATWKALDKAPGAPLQQLIDYKHAHDGATARAQENNA